MVLGDGIRRNVAKISAEERSILKDAILAMDTKKFFPDGVSYFDKQEEIHKAAHLGGSDVHGGPGFLPWHRELCNRFEDLLREINPDLSLHYWDWSTDPRSPAEDRVALFTPEFMGNSIGDIGKPFADFETTEPDHRVVWRQLGVDPGSHFKPADEGIISQGSYYDFRRLAEEAHNIAHKYIGGTLIARDGHYAFHDPFVFFLHSNLDRLWAMWQTQPGKEWRLDPFRIYGPEWVTSLMKHNVEPWSGGDGLRPWAPPDSYQSVKMYDDPSIVIPRCYDTLPTRVEFTVPGHAIHFNDVPERETAIRAAIFKIYSCNDVTLEVKPGYGPSWPYSVFTPDGPTSPSSPFPLESGSVTIRHAKSRNLVKEARLWFAFTGDKAGTPATSEEIIVKCLQSGEDFHVKLYGNTITRPKVGVVLTLDQSKSMDELAGTTTKGKKIDILREAAKRFIELIHVENGVGIVSFNEKAYRPFALTAIPVVDPDTVRKHAKAAIQSLEPEGMTSIGNGVEMADNILSSVTGYEHEAIVILTDGRQTVPKWISDIRPLINKRTFAIGLGTEYQINVGALRSLTNNTDGELLLTGKLSPDTDDYFRLSKYFLQVLAGVTNTEIVRDPSDFINVGTTTKIPFVLNETDIEATIILLTDIPAVNLTLETPDGNMVDPAMAARLGATYLAGTNMTYYRFNLPMQIGTRDVHSGNWNAALEVQESIFKRYLANLGNDKIAFDRAISHGIRYSLNVHTSSNLKLKARLIQYSFEPGVMLTIRAVLTEYGLPVNGRAKVNVHLTRPDRTMTLLFLIEIEPGVFETSIIASMSGIYIFQLAASGTTMRGLAFTRERTLTGTAFSGCNNPNDPVLNTNAQNHQFTNVSE